jgi:hypothetical protein
MNDATKRPPSHGWRWVRLGEVCEFIRGVILDNQDIGRSAPINRESSTCR